MSGSFPLTFLYIEFYFGPVNRLNKLFSRIFRKCLFLLKFPYLVKQILQKKHKKKTTESGPKATEAESVAVVRRIGETPENRW